MSARATKVIWDDRLARTAPRKALASSSLAAKRIAQQLSPSRSVSRSIAYRLFGAPGAPNMAMLRAGHPLAHLFERGRRGGYEIAPRERTALHFSRGDGGFSRGMVRGGAMAPRPYMSPAGIVWPRLYTAEARRQMIIAAAKSRAQMGALLQ